MFDDSGGLKMLIMALAICTILVYIAEKLA